MHVAPRNLPVQQPASASIHFDMLPQGHERCCPLVTHTPAATRASALWHRSLSRLRCCKRLVPRSQCHHPVTSMSRRRLRCICMYDPLVVGTSPTANGDVTCQAPRSSGKPCRHLHYRFTGNPVMPKTAPETVMAAHVRTAV
jgi:hypothetical protein